MGTRCMIGVPRRGGKIGTVYCHSDGYPEGPYGVGHVLAYHWQDLTKARKLYDHGGMSFLGQELGHKHVLFRDHLGSSGSDYNGCGFYTRDDGRPIEDARQRYDDRAHFSLAYSSGEFDAAYAYLHNGVRGWLMIDPDTGEFISLQPVASDRYASLVVRHRNPRVPRRIINLG